MAIAEPTLTTLEFPKIRDRLAHYTSFTASRELALTLQPTTDPTEVRRALAFTGEARALLDEAPDLTIGAVRDIRRAVLHTSRGGVIDGPSLREVSGTVAAIRMLRARLLKLDPSRYPLLLEHAGSMPALPPLDEAIERAIGEDGQVLDEASPRLAELRREVRIALARLHEKLQHLITSRAYADALQEPIITVRNGRYVVPVKASHRKQVHGLVHDQSSSGATLYIEPMAVVELNNRWRELQSAEEEEVQRVLKALSEQVGAAASLLVAAVETTAALDLVFAKARFAAALRAIEPVISPTSEPLGPGGGPAVAPLLLTEARHPLLDPATVVPITLWLGAEARILLITGPNTGGKTVALKTTGLLALMAQAGLHIPAAPPSRLPVFEHIFADIGDEQSIEQSLSTFSSHMRNIIHMLRVLDEAAPPASEAQMEARRGAPPVLVLLDELGAGTDPVEGAALARAIIERLLERGVLAVATTHYAELKAFAYATPGVQNASVEFDVETLAPTYRLSIGLPGRSNALAIASRLGLDPALVERARAIMDRREVQVEDLLAGIHRQREATEAALRRAEELREDAEKYRDRLAQEWRAFDEQREMEAEAARRALEEDLREIRLQLKRLRDDLRSAALSREWLEEAERRLAATADQLKHVAAKRRSTVAPSDRSAPSAPRPLQPGDTVLVRPVGLKGTIAAIDPDDETAQVQVGGFRMTVDLKDLQRVKGAPDDPSPHIERSVTLPPVPDVSMTLDMRGWRAHEVAERLDRYLNDAYLAGLHQVRLIHGKGTGALRQAVREVLQQHPLVASFTGGGSDGGDGVTIATLVES